MDILKIIGFIFIALFLYLLFKDKRGDLAILVLLCSGVMVFIYSIGQINEIITFLKSIAEKAGIDGLYLGVILKIIGIAYLASFCSEICKDAGAGTLASKVEFSGKLFILILAIPILMAVLNSILEIL
ncbi:MAG: stage III sporulation protein AD [Clostridium sp.]|nr:stage III sporulation protein AD [Clostridium sp.]MCI7441591.1 stage III sporulation protein AD [Clostridium sp.]MDY4078370.1 stage III sporulation protein AD [Clostridium sp.]